MAINTAAFEAQRRGVEDDYNAKATANTFGRYVGQQRFARTQGDNQQTFQRGYAPMASQYGRRGLAGPGVSSGIYQRAMQNYVGDYTQQQGYLQQDQDYNDQQFVSNDANLAASRARALADIQAQQQQAISEAALQIQALKPYFS